MRTAGALAVVVLVLLNAFASIRILRSGVTSRLQKAAWVLFAWLVPLLGAILALQLCSERSTPAPVRGSYGTFGLSDPGIGAGSDCTTGGHGGDGGCGDGGGH